ncbi:MAG: nuclear transport factor 2 family protein [Proteobacteria bacterium]|nr:nuclear transport factor 2 family protein [Pseudomonadota bacterium]
MTTVPVRPAGLALVASGLLALAACAPSAPLSPAVPPELKHSWEVAFNQGDADAIAALYAPQAQLVMPGAEPVRGRERIRAAVLDMIRSGVKVKIGTEENVGSGNVAYVYGPYQVVDAQGHVAERGHYVETWRRDSGRWLIDIDINTAGPAEAVPAATP